MDEVTGDERRLHNEELRDLYRSVNVIRVIKARRIRWARHVARMGERRGAYRILMGKPEGKKHLRKLGIDGRIILIWILKEKNRRMLTELIWHRIRTNGGFL
jgi:hypothetical protein